MCYSECYEMVVCLALLLLSALGRRCYTNCGLSFLLSDFAKGGLLLCLTECHDIIKQLGKESARARSRTCCNLFATFVEKPQPRKDERKEKQNNMYRVHFLESISIIPHVVVDNSSFRKDNSIPELILWSCSRKGGLK